jgi:hypothetical protein
MAHRRFGLEVPQRRAYRFARERCKAERGDEARAGVAEHRQHPRAGAAQRACQFERLESGDAAADDKEDGAALHGNGLALRSKAVERRIGRAPLP